MNMRKMQVCISLVAIIILLVPVSGASAQGNQPPAPLQPQKVPQHETGPGQAIHIPGSIQGPNGDGYYLTTGKAAGESSRGIHLQEVGLSGVPDDYGYIWNDGTHSWIDATGGVSTGLSRGDSSGVMVSQAIDIGFSFPFYENSYSQLYISTSGAVGFDEWSLSNGTWTPYVPSTADPNNFIAPYLAPLQVNATNYPGEIYYLKAGTTPDRYMVIEWFNAKDDIGGTFTFEAVLHENGDIDFIYSSMVHGTGYYCNTAAAIENADGSEGLTYISPEYCNDMSGSTGKDILFSHPMPSARVWIPSDHAGAFSSSGNKARFKITMRNNGDLGTDTYNLSCSDPTCGFLASDGQTPLSNTDIDPRIDTGPVGQMQMITFWVTVDTPIDAKVGAQYTVSLGVHSSLGTHPIRSVTLTWAVPAAFAQTFYNTNDHTLRTLLVQPAGSSAKPAALGYYWASSPSIAEISGNRLISIWSEGGCLDTTCQKFAEEIYYSIQDRYGNIVSAPRKLADYSSETMSTEDYQPAVAVAPDGHIGLLYIHFRYDDSIKKANYNLYLTVFNPDGTVNYGPANLTNYTTFFSDGASGALYMFNPTIAATSDNRFVTAWEQEHINKNNSWLEDIYTAVRTTSGGTVQNPTLLLTDTGNSSYFYPYLASLPSQHVLLTYSHIWSQNNIFYEAAFSTILTSYGGTAGIGPVAISDPNNGTAYQARAVKLSDGKIMVGWISYDFSGQNLAFRIFDGGLNPVAGPASLDNPIAKTGSWGLSVTADSGGHGILSWVDGFGGNNLYYALVDSAGNILTLPMIGHSVPFGEYLYTSNGGYGVTTYSWVPPTVVDSRLVEPAIVPVQPAGTARIPIHIENRGGPTAHGITLTAQMGNGLTYAGSSFGVTPVQSLNQFSWSLPDLEFLETRDYYILASIPNDALGTLYPVSLSLKSTETDANPADNDASLSVMSAAFLYLPTVTR